MERFSDIKRELLNELRNSDIIPKATRGVTTKTVTFSGTGVLTDFSLSDLGVKNIRSVSVSSVAKTFGEEWDFSENKTTKVWTIEFTTAPASGTNNISVTYDYTTTIENGLFVGDRIYSDFAKVIINSSKFPRVGFDIIASPTEVKSTTGSPLLKTRINIIFNGYGNGKDETETLNDDLRDFLDVRKKSFYYLQILRRISISQMRPFEGVNDKIFFRENVYIAPFEFTT